MSQQPIEIPPPSLDDVLFEKKGNVGWVTLNRPVVLNAINWSILRRLMVALEQAESDPEVRAVILTGAGRSFCAGGDLQSTRPDDNERTPSAMEIYMKMWQMPKPIIAAVKGHAVGQGCELAGICDMTVAAENANFGELQIRHGFGPPLLIAPFLVGLKQAKELLMLGDMIDAREAQRLGLVNRVVPEDEVLAEAERMATKIASLSQKAVRTNKILVNRVYELAGFRQGINYRDDPLVQALASDNPEPSLNEHIQVLRERGWEAFRDSRDAIYRRE